MTDYYIYPYLQAAHFTHSPFAIMPSPASTESPYGPRIPRLIEVPHLDEETFQLFNRAITQAEKIPSCTTTPLPSCPISDGILKYIMYTVPKPPRRKEVIDLTQKFPLQVPSPPNRLGLRSPFVSSSPRPHKRPVQFIAPTPPWSPDAFPDAPSVSITRTPSATQSTPSPKEEFTIDSIFPDIESATLSVQNIPLSLNKQNPKTTSTRRVATASVRRRRRPRNSTCIVPSPPPPEPTQDLSASGKRTFDQFALDTFYLLHQHARKPRGLATFTGLPIDLCRSIFSQLYRHPPWLSRSHMMGCWKYMENFGRSERPGDKKSVQIPKEVGWQCLNIGSEVGKSWVMYDAIEERDGQFVLKFAPDSGIPISAVLDFQHNTLYPWVEYDAATKQYSINCFTIPIPVSFKFPETIPFGLAKQTGVPVRLTAEGIWTVNDGHRMLFDEEKVKTNPSVRDVTLQLVWPGYLPVYRKVHLSVTCTRQEFARIICTEMLVWAAISYNSQFSQECEHWSLRNMAFMETLWLVSASKWECGLWTVELHLS
ncbi:hypothetical protein BDY19DRAFT_956291 [Irpex rosettiformis]|uniref:Uncharacterized protein n=1 Tax=Irpex rosettiformis TaxID=378272 RepID=A0ACB8TYR5_9APHY|nr:hypothetical protein BDY19DRAFT_956291 [Irpex rosettiformis]